MASGLTMLLFSLAILLAALRWVLHPVGTSTAARNTARTDTATRPTPKL